MAETKTLTKEAIPRLKLKPQQKFSEETKQIAREALVVLGYSQLHRKVIEGEESLRDVLRRLDIQPLDWNAVSKYKKQLVDAAREKHSYKGWQTAKLNDFDDELPLFVLRRATQIKLAAPKAKFSIEYLSDDKDPFLIVTLGDDWHYVDVWDERDFEAKL